MNGFYTLMTVDRIKTRHAGEIADAESNLLQINRTVPDQGISTSTELETEVAKLQATSAATRE